jgi:hypothetical protein
MAQMLDSQLKYIDQLEDGQAILQEALHAHIISKVSARFLI